MPTFVVRNPETLSKEGLPQNCAQDGSKLENWMDIKGTLRIGNSDRGPTRIIQARCPKCGDVYTWGPRLPRPKKLVPTTRTIQVCRIEDEHRIGLKVPSETELPFRDASEDKLLNDLLAVGPEKPVGSLPLETVEKLCRVDPRDVVAYLERAGISTVVGPTRRTKILVLTAYHRPTLQKMLDENRRILEDEGWPTDADGYAAYLQTHIGHREPLHTFIAHTFANPFYKRKAKD